MNAAHANRPDGHRSPAVAAFDDRAIEYDNWFDRHPDLYRAEIAAIAELLAQVQAGSGHQRDGLEIGVGTGRFAAALGIQRGIEPAVQMLAVARERGLQVDQGIAEQLPYPEGAFDYTAFITSLCFIPDAQVALREARRVTRTGGAIIVAFLNLASAAGQAIAQTQANDPYYAHAKLRTDAEIRHLLLEAGFRPTDSRQVCQLEDGSPDVTPGTDSGLFCAILGQTNA